MDGKRLFFLISILIVFVGVLIVLRDSNLKNVLGVSDYEIDKGYTILDLARWGLLKDWKRPEGPAKVAIQVGHWKVEEAPQELEFLLKNTGTSWGEHTEQDVNMEIALLTAAILEENGVITELFPVTIPPGHFADVFISIHADGSENENLNGFKSAGPWLDLTGDNEKLRNLIEFEYQKTTQLPRDPNITENMYGYYAFRWWGVDHSVHPMTTAIILETGYLSNALDRNIIVLQPELAAQGIANGIIEYLRSEGLIEK